VLSLPEVADRLDDEVLFVLRRGRGDEFDLVLDGIVIDGRNDA
jgi:hypothetical protein